MTKKSCTIYIICSGYVAFIARPDWLKPHKSLLTPYRRDSYNFDSKREAKLFSKKLRSALRNSKPVQDSKRIYRIYIDDLPF